MDTLAWPNSRALDENVAASVRELKKGDGPILVTNGLLAMANPSEAELERRRTLT